MTRYLFTVGAWVRVPGEWDEDYMWEIVYRGSNPFVALRRAVQAKRTSGCVRFEWR
jgi:hypothetical protein